jgi:predicted Fe-Mo cluster-binding NifX family protein
MKIAVTTQNDHVFQHFGQSPLFTVYEIENGQIKTKELLDPGGSGHSALAGLLSLSGIDAVICGGIGPGAVNMLGARGIQVISGAEGRTDAAVRAYLNGQLVGGGSNCDHHGHGKDGHGHECSCHDHCH